MSKQEQEIVGTFTENYIVNCNTISMIIFLVDIRHKPTENDLMMYNYVMKSNLPFMVLANKADKIAPTKVESYVEDLKKEFGISFSTILPFSSERKIYKDDVWEIIEENLLKFNGGKL